MIRELILFPVRVALLPLRVARRVVRRAGRELGLIEPERSPARPAPRHEPEPERPRELEPEPDFELEPTAVFAWVANGEPILLIDVRETEELKRTGVAEGALHIPLGQLTARKAELPRDKHLVLYCAAGSRSHGGANYLREQSWKDAWSVVGGLPNWMRAGGKVVPAT